MAAVLDKMLVAFVMATVWNGTGAFTLSAHAAGPRGPTRPGSPSRSCRHSSHHQSLLADRRPDYTGNRRGRRRRLGGEVADSRSIRPTSRPPLALASSSSLASSSASSVEGLLENADRAVSGRHLAAVDDDKQARHESCRGSSGDEARGTAATAPGRRGTCFPEGGRTGVEDRSTDPSSGLKASIRLLSVFGALAGLAAVAVDYEHGMAGFHWFQEWAGGAAPHFPSRAAGDGVGPVHFTPLKSVATGLGAGFTRAASRTLTFPLDTIKTRCQLSKVGAGDRALLPEEMRRLIDGPATFKGVFKGFSAFLVQAGPSNAAFFLFYDALNALGAAAMLGGDGGSPPSVSSTLWPTLFRLGASSVATIPANLVRTPAELVKQRLQVGQESGNALQALLSIVRAEGVRGLFVGGKEQLLREIPFNAVQFTVYECLKSHLGSSELWADAALGAVSSAAGAVATQPVDTVKTRVMTKSVPGFFGGESPGFLKSASLVAEAEGVTSLYLGLFPRLVLVSTGGAFYFWGQEFASQLMNRAGL